MLYQITSIRYSRGVDNIGREKEDPDSRARIGRVLEIDPDELTRVPTGMSIELPYVMDSNGEPVRDKVFCPSSIRNIHIKANGVILIETLNSIYEFHVYEPAGQSHAAAAVHTERNREN